MAKSRNQGFKPGDYWISCDRCGEDYRRSQTRKEWNGLVVCRNCWESRHPQDMVRGKKDVIAPQGDVRPEPTEDFNFTPISLHGKTSNASAIAGIAIAGVAIAGTS